MGKRRTRKHHKKHHNKHHNKHGKKNKGLTRKMSSTVKVLNSTVKKMIKKLTGKPFRGTIGVVSKTAIKRSTPFLQKIPMAGNMVVYIFRKGEKGFYIALTTADNMVDSAGNIVTSVMDGATDLVVLSLNTVAGR